MAVSDKLAGLLASMGWTGAAASLAPPGGVMAATMEPMSAALVGATALALHLHERGHKPIAAALRKLAKDIEASVQKATNVPEEFRATIARVLDDFDHVLRDLVPTKSELVTEGRLNAANIAEIILGKFEPLSEAYQTNANASDAIQKIVKAAAVSFCDDPVLFTELQPTIARQLLADTGLLPDIAKGVKQAQQGIVSVQTRLNLQPDLSWPEQARHSAMSVTEGLRYNSGRYAFVGRDNELEYLERFAGSSENFSWLLISGDGGEGKSRLAFEFTRRLRERDWNAGRMRLADLESFDFGKWQPDRPTFIVVDYPAQRPKLLHEKLTALTSHAEKFQQNVRVLLLERDASGQWFKEMVPETSDGSLITSAAFDGKANGFELRPMLPDAIITLMKALFESQNIAPPDDQALLLAAHFVDRRAVKIDQGILPLPRPLFAMAAAEALLEGFRETGQFPQNLARDEVLQKLLERDESQFWFPTAAGISLVLKEKHKNLLALVTLCLGVEKMAWSPDCKLLPSATVYGADPVDYSTVGRMSGVTETHIAELEPDILGEFFALKRLAAMPAQERDVLLNQAFEIAGNRVAVFMLRSYRDFPERMQSLEHFNGACDLALARAKVLSAYWTSLFYVLNAPEAVSRVAPAYWEFRQKAAQLNDSALRIELATAASNFIAENHAAAGLIELHWLKGFVGNTMDPALRLTLAKASYNIITKVDAATGLTEFHWLKGFVSDTDNPVLRLELARAATNFLANADAATAPPEFHWLKGFVGDADDPALRQQLAKAATNFIAKADAATGLTEFHWLKGFVGDTGDPALRLQLAEAAINFIGKADDATGLIEFHWLKGFVGDTDDPALQLELAKAQLICHLKQRQADQSIEEMFAIESAKAAQVVLPNSHDKPKFQTLAARVIFDAANCFPDNQVIAGIRDWLVSNVLQPSGLSPEEIQKLARGF